MRLAGTPTSRGAQDREQVAGFLRGPSRLGDRGLVGDSWLGAGKMEHPDRREESDHASVSAFGAEYLLVLFNEVLAPTLGLVGDITKNGLGSASCGPGCCRTTNCTPTRHRSH
jgi:hypothetical protein